MNRAGRAESDDVGHADLRVRDQPILGAIILGQMPDDLADIGDAGSAERMTLGEEAAGDIYGSLTAEAGMHAAALGDDLARFAVTAESEVLVVDQLGGRETIVQLGQRDILRAEAGGLVGLF